MKIKVTKPTILVTLAVVVLAFCYGANSKLTYDDVAKNLKRFVIEAEDIRSGANVFTYGKNIKDEYLELALYYFDSLPATFDSFIKEGGQIFVAENYKEVAGAYFYMAVDENGTGMYFRNHEGIPVIALSNNNDTSHGKDMKAFLYTTGTTEIHELAHYMDDLYGFSSSAEFLSLYKKYAASYQPRCSVIEGYATSSEKEFFAILVSDIVTALNIDDLNLPKELLEYMKEVFIKAEGENATRTFFD